MSMGHGKRYFDKETRVAEFEKKAKKNYNPGPGSYRSPSDFGQYDGDIYNYNLSMYKTSFSKSASRNSFSKLNQTTKSSRRRL